MRHQILENTITISIHHNLFLSYSKRRSFSKDEAGIVLDMDLVGNMVMVEEGMQEEGKLSLVEEEGKLKEPEGKLTLREDEDSQLAEEDKLKLVGILIAAEEGTVVIVGIEKVQSMVLVNMEMQKAVLSSVVLEAQMAWKSDHVSLLLHNVL